MGTHFQVIGFKVTWHVIVQFGGNLLICEAVLTFNDWS